MSVSNSSPSMLNRKDIFLLKAELEFTSFTDTDLTFTATGSEGIRKIQQFMANTKLISFLRNDMGLHIVYAEKRKVKEIPSSATKHNVGFVREVFEFLFPKKPNYVILPGISHDLTIGILPNSQKSSDHLVLSIRNYIFPQTKLGSSEFQRILCWSHIVAGRIREAPATIYSSCTQMMTLDMIIQSEAIVKPTRFTLTTFDQWLGEMRFGDAIYPGYSLWYEKHGNDAVNLSSIANSLNTHIGVAPIVQLAISYVMTTSPPIYWKDVPQANSATK